MLTTFNNRTVTIRRLKDNGNKQTAYSATATADASIQNIETEDGASKEGVARKAYKAWFSPDTDIQVNDKLTDQEGHEYRVMGVEKLGDGLGIESDHLEVVLHRFTS